MTQELDAGPRDSTDLGDEVGRDALFKEVTALQDGLLDVATGQSMDNDRYVALRRELLDDPIVGPHLPAFVSKCRDLGQFWSFIKNAFSTYQERREFLWDEFDKALEIAETGGNAPADASIEDTLQVLGTGSVVKLWHRALRRRASDPEGAITLARTLLETVCKHILDDLSVTYDDNAKLPELYRLTSKELRLAPSQHAEEPFKRILGGCSSVVEGLGTLRNRLSDAHGKGQRLPAKPAPRHAELAVNLAGAMAAFLVATWEARNRTTASGE
jgi:hypothetical protein